MNDDIFEEISPALKTLDDRLTPEKVAADFKNYIFEREPSAVIWAATVGQPISVEISVEDKLTILSKRITYGHPQMTLIPVVVHVAIGDCSFDGGTYSTSKCSADLLYNHYLELASMDFYYDSLHDSKL